MDSSRIAKWLSLAPGDVITFSRKGLALWGGVIDDRTEDGHIIWVTDEVGTRRLVHSQDEYDFAVSGNVCFSRDPQAMDPQAIGPRAIDSRTGAVRATEPVAC